MTDIFEASGAQQGIGDSMGEDIGVRVAYKASLEGYLHSAEDKLTTALPFLREGVDIYAQADSKAQFRTP